MRGADTEGHTGCDSTDGKHAEQANPQTQTVGSWWSGAGGEGLWVVIAKVCEGHFWGDGKFPEQGTGMATWLGEMF